MAFSKNITLFIILLLVFVSINGLRIRQSTGSNDNTPTNTNLQAEDLENPTVDSEIQPPGNQNIDSGNSGQNSEVTSQSSGQPATPATTPSSNDFLIITRSSTSDVDSEASQIRVTNEAMQSTMRAKYRELRKAVEFTQATMVLYKSDRSFSFEVGSAGATSTSGKIHSLRDTLPNFFDLDDKFSEINQLFSISDEAAVVALKCTYVVSNDLKSVTKQQCSGEITPINGFYKVEATKLVFSSIKIDTPQSWLKNIYQGSTVIGDSNLDDSSEQIDGDFIDDRQPLFTDEEAHHHYVTYEGYITYGSGEGSTNEDSKAINNKVFFKTTKNTRDIVNFDIKNPQFEWIHIIEEGEMTLNLFLAALDQSRSTNSRPIAPPRGLSSINKLSMRSAAYTSEAGKQSGEILAIFDVPDFAFLPLEMSSHDNVGYLSYTNSDKAKIEIKGITSFTNGENYNITFIKEADESVYTITMDYQIGSTLTFDTIRDNIFSTISTEIDSILCEDESCLETLGKFNITEEDTTITSPTIEIRLEPYLYYQVRGFIKNSITSGKSQN